MHFLFGHVACRIPFPCSGIQPVLPAAEAWSVNHWTTREAPTNILTSILSLPFLPIL